MNIAKLSLTQLRKMKQGKQLRITAGTATATHLNDSQKKYLKELLKQVNLISKGRLSFTQLKKACNKFRGKGRAQTKDLAGVNLIQLYMILNKDLELLVI